MTATGRTRATRTNEEEDALKRVAPEAEGVETVGVPAVPNLDSGPLEPDAWLALQQTIGNSAVGGMLERRRASQALPSDIRHDMEQAYGQNFGQVQIHSGPDVDRAAQAMDAAAFTAGDDIYVHSALPGFDDPVGREVLGEELAHVAQGVGRDGSSRLTDPSETAERAAHRAGADAAAGRHAEVETAPEAAGAVARFDLGDDLKQLYDWATGGTEAGTPVEKTDLSDEEKDRLSAGALGPLSAYWTHLGDLELAAKDGKHTAAAAKSIAISSDNLADFIQSFNGPPAIQPTIQAAAAATINGHQALIAASDPEAATKATVGILASISNDVAALAGGPQPAATPGATPAPSTGPAPSTAPAPGATPAPTPSADTLTAAEAEQVKFGAVEPLKIASQQLAEEQPDLASILIGLKSVAGVLRSISKVPALAAKALIVDGQVTRLEAAQAGTQGAIGIAMSQWGTAITLLRGLTAKSPAGGAAKQGEAPAASGDDDKPKDSNQPGQ